MGERLLDDSGRGLRVLTGPNPNYSVDNAELSDAGQLSRGWRSAALGEEASAIMTNALKAYEAGDDKTGQELEKRARTLAAEAEAWSPRVQKFTDIGGLRDGMNWAAGAVGSGAHSSLKPAAAGLTGAAAGSAAGPIGTIIGGAAGAYGASYDASVDEAAMKAMTDKEVREKRSYEDILTSARQSGALQAIPDAAGAGLMTFGRKVIGREVGKAFSKETLEAEGRAAAKKLADDVAEKGAARYVAGRTAEGMAGEAVTGGTQSVIGQTFHNDLAQNNKGVDWKDVLNDAAAEAAGGTVGGGFALIQAATAGKSESGEAKAPSITTAGEALGAKAAKLIEEATAPKPKNMDLWMLNNPLDASLSDEELHQAADARARAATNVAAAHFEAGKNTPETHASAKFLGAMKAAGEDKTAIDAAVNEYKNDLNHANEIAEFEDAMMEFRSQTDSKNSDMTPIPNITGGSNNPVTGSERRDQTPAPTQQGKNPGPRQLRLDVSNPSDTRVDLAHPSAQQTREQAQKVAQAWMGRNAKVSEVFGNLNTNDPSVRNGAEALFNWVVDGMPNFDKVSNALGKMWGKNAVEMVKSAHEYAKVEGLLDKSSDISKNLTVLTAVVNKGNSRRDQLSTLIRPTLQEQLTTSNVKELDRILNAYASGEVVPSMNEMMDRYFGQNKDEVFALYEKAPDESVAEMDKAAVSEGKDEDGDTIESSDWAGNIQEESAKTVYHGISKDTPFDTIYDNAKQALEKVKSSTPGGVVVGAWTRLKRDLSEHPDALREQEDSLIKKYGDHGSVKQFSSRRGKLNAINKRVVFLADTVREENEAVDLTEADLKDLKVKSGSYGLIVFERKVEDKSQQEVNEDGEITFGTKLAEWQTSASKLIQRMRQARDEGGFEDQKEGSLDGAEQLRQLYAGISSVMQVEGFTGRVGIKNAQGEVQWLKDGAKSGPYREQAGEMHQRDQMIHTLTSLLPDTFQVWGNGTTIADLKKIAKDERRDGDRAGNIAYAENVAEKKVEITKHIAELKETAKKLNDEGLRAKANKLLRYVDILGKKFSDKSEKNINKLYGELRNQYETSNDKPKKTAAETRITQRVRGKKFKEESTGVTDDFGNSVTEEGVETVVETKVYRDDPTELDEMSENAKGEDPASNRDLERSLDRDEVGQDISERSIRPSVGGRQEKYINTLLSKGVPAFVKAVKDMTESQRFAIRAALREMVKAGKLEGDMLTKAKNALKALRTTELEDEKVAELKSSQKESAENRERNDYVGSSGSATKPSNQKQTGVELTPDEQQAIKDELLATLGNKVSVEFKKLLTGNASGKWVPDLIRLALNSAFGTHRHEAMHQLFHTLIQAGSAETVRLLESIATNKMVLSQVRRLLQDHPKALKQLSNPEEAAAYMYQFWKAGLISFGPKSETFFQKIANFIKSVLGMTSKEVRDLQHAEAILQAFSDGKFAAHPDAAAKVMEKALVKQRKDFENNFWNKLEKSDVLRKAVFTAGDVLRDTKMPQLIKLADMLYTPEGGKANGKQSYFDAVPQQRAAWLNKLNDIFKPNEKEDVQIALKHLQGEVELSDIHDPVVRNIVIEVRKFLDNMYDNYLVPNKMQRYNEETRTWEPMPKIRKNYFPRVWDVDTLMTKQKEFIESLIKHHTPQLQKIADESGVKGMTVEKVAEAIHEKLTKSNGIADVTETTSDLGITPQAKAVNKRSLTWLDAAAFEPFMSKDLSDIMTSYTVQMVKRAEYTKRFGPAGGVINDMLDEAMLEKAFDGNADEIAEMKHRLSGMLAIYRGPADEAPTIHTVVQGELGDDKYFALREEFNLPIKAIMAAEGTIGRDIDPNLQKAFGYITFYHNFRVLALSLFSSFIDPLGIMVRGGTMNDAYEGFVRGVKEVVKGWKGETSQDEMAKFAERIGTVDAGTFMDALGQTYSSMYVQGRVRKWNDAIFKWNGMEAWNRAMRIQATAAAIGFIEKHLTSPTEHSSRYLKDELGLMKAQKNYMKDGKLNTSDPAVEQAIVRWVNGAILRPNAMQRPIMASDPHYELVYHLKQFTYSFHKTILTRAAVEAQHGNMTPVMTLAAAYVPMMIAADVIKELLRPGDEPAWMKQGLGEYVQHGIMRANLMGIPQFGVEAVNNPFDNPEKAASGAAKLFGPTAEQVMEWLEVPLSEEKTFGGALVQSMPLQPLYSRLVQ